MKRSPKTSTNILNFITLTLIYFWFHGTAIGLELGKKPAISRKVSDPQD